MATTMLTEEKQNYYLTFKLGEELFAANVSQVNEILEVVKITRVPHSPKYMKGVLNLRGNVLSVIDTKIKFGMEPTVETVSTCVMVMEVEIDGEMVMLGSLVDAVLEVIEISPKDIMAPPSIGVKYRSEFIEGVVRYNEQFVILLNKDKVFSSEDASVLNGVAVNN